MRPLTTAAWLLIATSILIAPSQSILEARLEASIAAVAGRLADAWTAGGRPVLPVDALRFNRRVSGRPR